MSCTGTSQAAILYGTSLTGSPGESRLYAVDTSTGLTTPIGDVGYIVTGMDFYNGVLYGVTSFRDRSYHGLIVIDTAVGVGTEIGTGWGFGAHETIVDLAIDSAGNAYGWDEPFSDDLSAINLAAGTASIVGDSGWSTSVVGLAHDRSNDLYLVNVDGDVFSINATTGSAALVNSIGVTAHHGDVDPDTGLYWGVNGRASLVRFDLLGSNVMTLALDHDLHTLAFGPATEFGPPIALAATAVPEPATIGIWMTIGLLGFSGRRWPRRV